MYYLIGISLLFTTFFTINVASSLAAAGLWRTLQRFVSGWPPARRSALLFALRVTPVALAGLFVFGFVLPAFLLYEPHHSGETVGLKLTIVVTISAFGIAAAMFRVFASWWRTRRLVSDWLDSSDRAVIDGISMPAYRLRHAFPVFAIVGIFRPRMFIAEQLLDKLDATELSAVITHELGHVAGRDNLRRVLMRICRDLLVLPVGRVLDRDWADVSEAAADEFAVGYGGKRSALELASALIKIARDIPSGPMPEMPSAAFAAKHAGEALADRIRRLLALADIDTSIAANVKMSKLFATSIFVLLVLLALLASNSYILARVHDVSELVVAILK
jgi:Zn-dependent protease with chaperone function